jgi:diacylglycerol kinase (ATP)
MRGRANRSRPLENRGTESPVSPLNPARKRSRRGTVPPYPSLQGAGIWDAFTHAWNGLIHTIVHQRNMRIHMLAAILVGLVGSGIPLGLAEKVTLIFCVLFVFFAEILNSALEQLVDLAIQEFDEKARLTKDAAAAGVLVLAVGTAVIFAALLVHNWQTITSRIPQIQRQVLLGLPLVACGHGLMAKVRKPLAVDVALFLGGVALMIALVLRSESYVFSALTFGLLVLCGASALERRKSAT